MSKEKVILINDLPETVKDSYRFNRMLVQIYEHCVEKRDRAKEDIAKIDDYDLRNGTEDRSISYYCQAQLDIANDIIKIIDEGGN